MRVLITGANGFIGNYLANKFDNCVAITRNQLDLTNNLLVEDFFSSNDKFDVIIHCAVKGGRRTVKYGPEILYENLLAFENIINHSGDADKFIHYSSGAEFTISDNNYYGMSKHIISNRLKQYKNSINIRIYNCFGEKEENQRFIKTCIVNMIENKDVNIFKNKYMDFFYIEDLYRLTKFVMESEINELDAVYDTKYTLLDIANKIKDITNSSSDIILNSMEMDSPYIGDSSTLKSLNLDLIGLENGIKNEINHILKERP